MTLDAGARTSNIYAFISVSDKLKIRSRLGTIFLYFKPRAEETSPRIDPS